MKLMQFVEVNSKKGLKEIKWNKVRENGVWFCSSRNQCFYLLGELLYTGGESEHDRGEWWWGSWWVVKKMKTWHVVIGWDDEKSSWRQLFFKVSAALCYLLFLVYINLHLVPRKMSNELEVKRFVLSKSSWQAHAQIHQSSWISSKALDGGYR